MEHRYKITTKSRVINSSLVSLTVLMVTVWIAVISGNVHIDISSIWQAQSSDHMIIWDIRVPRILMAAIAGAVLGLTGAVYQAMLDNPLAEPYILGVSSGATFGAVLSLSLGLGWFIAPIFGLVCAALSLSVVYMISGKKRHDNTRLILAGIIMNTMLGALLTLVISISGTNIGNIVMWLMGNLQNTSYTTAAIAGTAGIIGGIIIYTQSKRLNLLMLSDEHAIPLGVDIKKTKNIMITTTSIMIATTVSFVGMIGFVGLIIPHMTKLLFGYDNRLILPLSALSGAIFLITCDIISRTIIAPSELPVGVITAIIGAPLFLYLLKRSR